MAEFDLLLMVGAFIVVSFIIAFLLKRFAGAQTTLGIISLLKTTRPLWVFDRLAKHKRFFNALADIGLLLGFGAIAVDFLYGSKKRPLVRALIFVLSFIAFTGLFFLFDVLSGNAFSQYYMIKAFFLPMAILFGLIGFTGFILFFLVLSAWEIIYRYMIGERACPGVAPLIPGVEIPRVPFTAPFWVWIPLFLILIIHEASHGVLARIAKIPVKSTGLLLLGFLPIGAFVEPDDIETAKKSKLEKARLFSAGVASNLAAFAGTIAAILVLSLVVSFFFGAWIEEVRVNSVKGVIITKISERVELCGSFFDSPAFGKIEEGSHLLKVNNVEVKSANTSLIELAKYRFQSVTFLLEKEGVQKEITLSSNSLGSFGFEKFIENIPNENYTFPQGFKVFYAILSFISDFLSWFLMLNLLIALVNFLPVPFFDGGRIITILLFPYLGFLNKSEKDTEKLLHKIFIIIVLILFVINFLPVIF